MNHKNFLVFQKQYKRARAYGLSVYSRQLKAL